MTAYKITTPISERDARKLRIGDIVYVSGTIVAMRDRAHQRALEYHKQGKPIPVKIKDAAIYHCGPLAKKKGGKWEVLAAGPTTSMRIEAFEAELIEKLGARMIIGKGGMGASTAKAMVKYGAVYCDFPGGAAVLAALAVKKIVDIKWRDLGLPDALWVLEVEDFGPLTVTIDSHGKNLRDQVMERALKKQTENLNA